MEARSWKLFVNGALIVDKPLGPTSHDVVDRVRRALGTPRVGHTGTLDPLATGVLVLVVGRGTRLARFLSAVDKEYDAEVRLGSATPTYDAEARTVADPSRGHALTPAPALTEPFTSREIDAALAAFRGTYPQMPPPFSAKKVGGTRAYDRARRHEATDVRAVRVTSQVELLGYDAGLLRLRVIGSAGFYVRSLAHDLGRALGCGAHLERLRRTRAGAFGIDQASPLDAIETEGREAGGRLIPMERLLCHMPAVTLTEEGARLASHGNTVTPAHVQSPSWSVAPGGRVQLLDSSGALVAVAELGADALLHPLVVLV